MERSSGILLHITSLPNKYGLGCFSTQAYNFVDWLKKAGLRYWQVLPFEHTYYGSSPYSSYSAYAGNPYFIDLTEFLNNQQMLSFGFRTDVRLNKDDMHVAYFKALKYIYNANKDKVDLTRFKKKNEYWLQGYAMFMAIKESHNNALLKDFPIELKLRDKVALQQFYNAHKDLVEFYCYVQYLFYTQWSKLKKYANDNGVKIIGDIAIYVTYDSCDVWENPEQFLLDDDLNCKLLSGVPPDYFNEDGQLWNNPIYDYDNMKKDNWVWWKNRIIHAQKKYDVARLDHYIGFIKYWGVPCEAASAKEGKWYDGPGYDLLKILKDNTKLELIAEDLGIITNEAIDVKNRLGLYGLKIVQFAFDGDDSHAYLPHNYEKECVAYIGNHDNDTFMSYLLSLDFAKLNRIKAYLNVPLNNNNDYVTNAMVEALSKSRANLVVYTTQDILLQGNESRMNVPGLVLPTNWIYQLNESDLTIELADKYYELNKKHNRV